jgi:hypothetical protein
VRALLRVRRFGRRRSATERSEPRAAKRCVDCHGLLQDALDHRVALDASTQQQGDAQMAVTVFDVRARNRVLDPDACVVGHLARWLRYSDERASPRTIERFTGRPGGDVGGVPRRAGLAQDARRWPTEVARGLWRRRLGGHGAEHAGDGAHPSLNSWVCMQT